MNWFRGERGMRSACCPVVVWLCCGFSSCRCHVMSSPSIARFHTAPPFPYHPYIIISPIMPPFLYPSPLPILLASLLRFSPHDAPYTPPSLLPSPRPMGPLLAQRPHLYQTQTGPFLVRLPAPTQSSSINPQATISPTRTHCR